MPADSLSEKLVPCSRGIAQLQPHVFPELSQPGRGRPVTWKRCHGGRRKNIVVEDSQNDLPSRESRGYEESDEGPELTVECRIRLAKDVPHRGVLPKCFAQNRDDGIGVVFTEGPYGAVAFRRT